MTGIIRAGRRVAVAVLRGVCQHAASVPLIREQMAYGMINDVSHREWLIHQIAIRQARSEADFDSVLESNPDPLTGFEDCHWLFSSNELNLGLSQLRFDEAAYLYRLVRRRDQPRIAELGRYKGGTTLLLAAAGGRVLSLENDLAVHDEFLPALIRALDHFSLGASVDAVLADAYTYPVEPAAFDAILVHCTPPTYGHTRALAERWWPGVATGGYLVLHATPWLPGAVQFVQDLTRSAEAWDAVRQPATPGENVFFRKSRLSRQIHNGL